MGGVSHTVNSDFTRDQFLEHAAALYDKHRYVTFTWTTGRQRSPKQNAALHLYCRQLADALNDAGYDMRKVLKPGVDIPWNEKSVKEYLWRPLQVAITGDESTTKPDRDEYPEVYETLYRHIAQKFGVTVPWPDKEHQP